MKRGSRSSAYLKAAVLVALGGAACGVEPGSETQEARQSLMSEGRCEVRPPFNPNFEPELEWAWSGSSIMSSHNQVMMTPVVVEVNGDGIPDVVFNTFAGGNYTTNGVLRAISGGDGHDLWAVTDATLRVRPGANIAAGDIDQDGLVEICTFGQGGAELLCFENTGVLKFRAASPDAQWGAPALADLNGDGQVEIIAGNAVFNNQGARLWTGSRAGGAFPFAADIDQDGALEVVSGNAVYSTSGALKCAGSVVGELSAVGNFDADPRGEIVLVSSGLVSLMDDNCTLLWSSSVPGGGGGPPNIADFDNDGQPEIGVAGRSFYVVFETSGTVKWSSPTRDFSSQRTGSSTFDFEGDGRSEVIYGDEVRLRIYDGSTGAIRFDVQHASGTIYENPVIVDVDGDNNAEIVMPANNYAFSGPTGIRVFRDRRDGWVNTRRIWNQHAYSVTNVNDDGTIPAHPATNWLTSGLNTFRSNSQGTGTTSPFAAADLIASEVGASCDNSTQTVTLSARVTNQGDAAASAGLQVAFFRGNPVSGGTLLGVSTLPGVLAAGASTVATLALNPAPSGSAEIFVVADYGPGTGHELECREDNNTATASVELTCVANLPPVALCRDLTVSADAQCQGHGDVNNGSYDPDHSPEPLALSYTPAGPFSPGSHPVTLTAFDGMASDQCVGTITVVDNTPPAISCPGDQVLECAAGGAVATYSASATDNCSEAPTTCAPLSGSRFPVGTSPVTCSAMDAAGNTSACSFAVSVLDTLPPVPGPELGLMMWPPNHKYRTITLAECAAPARDQCGGTLPLEQYGRITRVTSDEVEDGDGNGDGHTCDDMIIGVGTTAVQLRAEREGTGDGRVYTLHYTITDPAGNAAEGTCRVSVPHDQSSRPAVDSGAKSCVGQGCPGGLGGSPRCQ